jgi:hypothetical protein
MSDCPSDKDQCRWFSEWSSEARMRDYAIAPATFYIRKAVDWERTRDQGLPHPTSADKPSRMHDSKTLWKDPYAPGMPRNQSPHPEPTDLRERIALLRLWPSRGRVQVPVDAEATEEPQADPWALPDGWTWVTCDEWPGEWIAQTRGGWWWRACDDSHDVRILEAINLVALRNRTDPPKTEEPTP